MNADGQPHWRAIEHVQIAIPEGGEEQARSFYAGVLGLVEVPKPAPLATRGGCWFKAGPVSVHVGVDAEFRPATKAHPALVVDDLRRLAFERGLAISWSDEIPGTVRGFVHDPFGNRIELIDSGMGE